jgi:hypothetical protein
VAVWCADKFFMYRLIFSCSFLLQIHVSLAFLLVDE